MMDSNSENIQLAINFNQVFDIIKNLSKKRKVQLFNYLQVDLSAPQKVNINQLYRYEDTESTMMTYGADEQEKKYKKPLLDIEMLDMLDEVKVEEPQLTDDEFYKTIEEMD